jgi:hypothetical protein
MMAVEVKTKLTTADVKDHLKRLKKMRTFAPGQIWEHKKLLGAVAGAIVNKNVRDFALKEGLFVVSQSGENLKVEAPQPPAHEW